MNKKIVEQLYAAGEQVIRSIEALDGVGNAKSQKSVKLKKGVNDYKQCALLQPQIAFPTDEEIKQAEKLHYKSGVDEWEQSSWLDGLNWLKEWIQKNYQLQQPAIDLEDFTTKFVNKFTELNHNGQVVLRAVPPMKIINWFKSELSSQSKTPDAQQIETKG